MFCPLKTHVEDFVLEAVAVAGFAFENEVGHELHSTFTVPSPLHSSQRPPSVLKEKNLASISIWRAKGCSAMSLRISSKALT